MIKNDNMKYFKKGRFFLLVGIVMFFFAATAFFGPVLGENTVGLSFVLLGVLNVFVALFLIKSENKKRVKKTVRKIKL